MRAAVVWVLMMLDVLYEQAWGLIYVAIGLLFVASVTR